MSGEFVPAALAAGGGAALAGGIAWHEYTRERAMRDSRVSFGLQFPVGAGLQETSALLRALSGLGAHYELLVEVVATAGSVRHLIHVPAEVADSVVSHFQAALPGARLDDAPARTTHGGRAIRFTAPELAVLRTDDVEAANRALLAGLVKLREGEAIRLCWALRPGHRARVPQPGRPATSTEARIRDRAVARRLDERGFLIAGLLVVSAKPSRAEALTEHITSVIRSRRSVGAGMLVRAGRAKVGSQPTTYRGRGWLSVDEVIAMLAWPLGDEVVPGVELGVSRRLMVPRGVPTEGRPLFVGRDLDGDRVVALTADAARVHAALLGPSGVGKSVAMARGILSDIERLHGGIVLDPKADLATDILDRVDPKHADRIVLLDPGAGGPVPGLDLFSSGDSDLRADVILGALQAIYKDAWGPRTSGYLRLGLATLSAQPRPVLTDWMRLFTDAGFRRTAVGRLSDPLLQLEWARFEALSAPEQMHHVQAPASRLIGLLARPAIRNVLAQERPRLDIPRLLAERKWLVVSLSPGTLGEPATRLLGAVIMYAVWSAVEQRAAIAPDKRHPVFLHVDELQTLASLPFGLEHLLERARGLGCGVTVATQAMGRLPESMRRSLLGNAATLVAFRQGHEEAERIARELPGITAADLKSLRPFEVAARVATGAGSGIAVMTGVTQPPAPVTGSAAQIRALSAERYGGTAATLALGPSSADSGGNPDEIDQIGRVS